MVEYTAINYVLISASAVLFTAIFIGCIILFAKEKTRMDQKKKDERRKIYLRSRKRVCERPKPTVTSPSVSLRGINEWHILPPIRQNLRNYTTDGNSLGYRASDA